LSVFDQGSAKTAFVFAGGGSFGAIQVGMLQRLADIWRGLQRRDVFPLTWKTLLGFVWRRDFLITHDGIRKLIDDHIPFRNLEDARLPVHIVTTDIISGDSIVLSEGSTTEAIVASTAIPGAFAPIRYRDHYLADGAISSNTPIRVAVKQGARRLIILPTGYACADQAPPVGAVANALHALTLLIARQLVSELEISIPASNISWCRRYARWWDHLTISRAHRIISSARSGPPMHGWPRAGWSRARSLTRCGCIATEAGELVGLRCSAKQRPLLGRLGAAGVTSVNLATHYIVYRLFRDLD
jgi:NTE family protein